MKRIQSNIEEKINAYISDNKITGMVCDQLNDQCDDTAFEIIMKMTKEEYKEMYNVSDLEIEKAYQEAVRNFDTNDFRIFDEKYTLEEFEERSEFGEKAYIDDCAYYKVRNNVDGQPYTIYFEEGDLRIL